MDREDIIQALRSYTVLAAELVPTVEGRTAWLAVYPLDPSRPDTMDFLAGKGMIVSSELPMYHIRAFEIPVAIANTWFGEDDMLNKQSHVASGEDALFQTLNDLCIGYSRLRPVDETEYPL
jgi:hypothetical protein